MSNQTTRRNFLQKIVMGAGAAAAAASGLASLAASRADLLLRLADHLNKIGYQVVRYSKF